MAGLFSNDSTIDMLGGIIFGGGGERNRPVLWRLLSSIPASTHEMPVVASSWNHPKYLQMLPISLREATSPAGPVRNLCSRETQLLRLELHF